MKKREINILSIDFDYFQDVSEETLFYYPDSHDLTTEISKFVWSSIYAHEKLNKIIKTATIKREALDITKAAISKCDKNADNWIVNSHMHMYEATKKIHDRYPNAKINIINIDMHHDCFSNEELDCGNWVNHVMNDFGASVTWIADEVGISAYSKCPNEAVVTTTDINIIADKKFDMVFLCRSDAWLPPHLDCYFDELRTMMVNTFLISYTDGNVNEPRNIGEFVKQQKEAIDAYDIIIHGMREDCRNKGEDNSE